MAWSEMVKWNPFDAAVAAARGLRESLEAATTPAAVPATVPVCRCDGACRCGTLVPFLLQRQIELECEFYRDVH